MRLHAALQTLSLSSVLFSVVLVAGCASPEPAKPGAKWTCAMHPGYVSDKPGECPICKMKLSPVGETPSDKGQRKLLYYRSPMNPAATSPMPRKDEMGMDYLPVYSDEVSGTAGPSGLATITINPERRRLIGLQTSVVHKGPIDTTIRTVGRIAFDETRIVKVQPRFEGFIERLDANFTGKKVTKGSPLAWIYSPEILASEQEYLLAIKSAPSLARSGLPDMAEAARARLQLMGISDRQLDEIARGGKPMRLLHIDAPISGVVTAKNVVSGAKVGPQDALFEIVDLSRVWLLADVYEYELPRLKLGSLATMTLSYWPDRVWKGRIGYIYPTVDEKTRTVRVRIEVENPKTELKPEMFADVLIFGPPHVALQVPEDAIIDTGTRKIVFVDLGGGALAPREITTGDHDRGLVEAIRGLSDGDVVARGASFLLDSESQLRAAIAQTPAVHVDGGDRDGAARPTGETP